ncbi:unnamed protein product [Bursaphelenchus xylophilus]|uniref:(pine wood nematode) hypothetical protein n=1 Tax=Bursaphelenchus xylophilus TaxID=6326 RepID=A0A1I7SUN7_BURXY|nr:unnamed protein product [Bursaphelenchus xylophilus]CAG9125992.1 unnamed protein product [Bursaphelenchus xylophilus]
MMRALLVSALCLATAWANYDGPRIYRFCGCMKEGEAFHVKGRSRMDQKDFVIQLNNNVDNNYQWGNRERYEVPFHIHMWFVHPQVRGLMHHYEIAYGPGMARKGWDHVENMPLNIARNQDYHYEIRKVNGGFTVALNGRVFRNFRSPRNGCTNGAYVTFTNIQDAWKDNDQGCTQPRPAAPRPAPRPAAPATRRPAPQPQKAPVVKNTPQPVHKPTPAKQTPATLPPIPLPHGPVIIPQVSGDEDC